jgi:YggT family protein
MAAVDPFSCKEGVRLRGRPPRAWRRHKLKASASRPQRRRGEYAAGRERGRRREQRAVGGSSAGSLLLADAVTWATSFVDVFVGVYILLIFAFVLLSWVRLPYSPTLERVQRFLYETCDPYLRLFRRIVRPIGGIDLSPIIAIFTLVLVGRLLTEAIERIM